MLILALDTSLQRCSVAILDGGQVLAEESRAMERGHAEHIAPMAAHALKKAGVEVLGLDRIGVVTGPGGFTGIRIALAFARGLVVGEKIPVAGVTSLKALAAGAVSAQESNDEDGAELFAAIIDARRGQVFGALYDRTLQELVAPFIAETAAAENIFANAARGKRLILTGSGASSFDSHEGWVVSEAPDQIDIKIVAKLAMDETPQERPPSPLYLRAPDAKPARGDNRLRIS